MEQSEAGAGGVGSTPGFRAVTSLAGSSLTPTCCRCWVPASPPQHLTPLSSATGCPMDPSTTYYTRGQVSADGVTELGQRLVPLSLGSCFSVHLGQQQGPFLGMGGVLSAACVPSTHSVQALALPLPALKCSTPCLVTLMPPPSLQTLWWTRCRR